MSKNYIEIDISTTPSAIEANIVKARKPIEISFEGIPAADVYQGEYEVTPSTEVQILPTGGLLMSGNVTVNPIPSNWGLITWNGVYLTVS